MIDYTLCPLSESCLLLQLDGEGDETTTRLLLSVYHELKTSPVVQALGIVDLVPAYQVLAIHFPGSEENKEDIKTYIRHTLDLETLTPYRAGKTHSLPVRYNGPDIDTVTRYTGLSAAELVQRHTEPVYFVAMIGFKSYFPYLMGLDPALEVPRLENPRGEVSAGAVGIGGNQTGVYPEVSPGGWNIIGQTNPALLVSIQPGDHVCFVEVNEQC